MLRHAAHSKWTLSGRSRFSRVRVSGKTSTWMSEHIFRAAKGEGRCLETFKEAGIRQIKGPFMDHNLNFNWNWSVRLLSQSWSYYLMKYRVKKLAVEKPNLCDRRPPCLCFFKRSLSFDFVQPVLIQNEPKKPFVFRWSVRSMTEDRSVARAAAESCGTVQNLWQAVGCNYSVSETVTLQIIYPKEQLKNQDTEINILYNVPDWTSQWE